MITSRVAEAVPFPAHANAAQAAPREAPRLEALDGMRGIAAFVVLIWHFFLAFLPLRVGSFPGFDPAYGLIGTPIFGLINGEAAVTFFFVLSGFVLPEKFLRGGDAAVLARGAAKRWFRLSGLVLIAATLSWALMRLGLYHYHEAAAISDSTWLDHFAEGRIGERDLSLGAALLQGGFWTFLRGDSYFDPSLWTMHFEFIGSLVAFGLAGILLRANWKNLVWITAVGVAIAQLTTPYLTAFVIGTALCAAWTRRKPRVSGTAAAALLLGAMLLFAFKEPRGIFSAVAALVDIPLELQQVWFHTIASVMAIVAVMGNDTLRRFLSSAPLRFLGTASFAMYLIHMPVYFSFTSWLYAALAPDAPAGVVAGLCFAASVALILPLSHALSRVDALWLRFVDRRLMKFIS